MSLDLTQEFEPLAQKCWDALFNQSPTEFEFPFLAPEDAWRENETLKNEQALRSLLHNGANVYLMWTRELNVDIWTPQYVGERMPKGIRQRIREHLFYKSPRTGSKLANVQQAVRAGQLVGLTSIKVIPDELRTAVEHRLMRLQVHNGTRLPWNIHGNR